MPASGKWRGSIRGSACMRGVAQLGLRWLVLARPRASAVGSCAAAVSRALAVALAKGGVQEPSGDRSNLRLTPAQPMEACSGLAMLAHGEEVARPRAAIP